MLLRSLFHQFLCNHTQSFGLLTRNNDVDDSKPTTPRDHQQIFYCLKFVWLAILFVSRELVLGVRKFPEISCGIFPEISGKIAALFRNNSAEYFQKFVVEIFATNVHNDPINETIDVEVGLHSMNFMSFEPQHIIEHMVNDRYFQSSGEKSKVYVVYCTKS